MRFESDPLVKLHDWTCGIDRLRYRDGSVALQLIDALDASPIATATVALDRKPPEGCVWIKDYSENVGVLKALVNAGVVSANVEDEERSGFVIITAHKLLLKEQS